MSRHRKKRKKPQNTNLAPNMHNDKDELLKQAILDFDEEMRKHKKKHKHEKLTVWEGLILLLLLKENGILEELVKTDEYEEFDENEYEEFGISKHNFNKNIEEETKEPDIKEHNKKNHFDFEYFAED